MLSNSAMSTQTNGIFIHPKILHFSIILDNSFESIPDDISVYQLLKDETAILQCLCFCTTSIHS